MENEGRNKQNDQQVDEAYMMSIIAGHGVKAEDMTDEPIKKEGEEKTAARERSRQKKSSDLSYGERFLTSHSMNRRGDKSIYIRQEYHERLYRIVQVIGEDKIPLYAYLDNIIEHHFEQFEKAITDDFNEKFKPIF